MTNPSGATHEIIARTIYAHSRRDPTRLPGGAYLAHCAGCDWTADAKSITDAFKAHAEHVASLIAAALAGPVLPHPTDEFWLRVINALTDDPVERDVLHSSRLAGADMRVTIRTVLAKAAAVLPHDHERDELSASGAIVEVQKIGRILDRLIESLPEAKRDLGHAEIMSRVRQLALRAAPAPRPEIHGVRECRGHFHVTSGDSDLAIPGDPFPTRDAAEEAARRLDE